MYLDIQLSLFICNRDGTSCILDLRGNKKKFTIWYSEPSSCKQLQFQGTISCVCYLNLSLLNAEVIPKIDARNCVKIYRVLHYIIQHMILNKERQPIETFFKYNFADSQRIKQYQTSFFLISSEIYVYGMKSYFRLEGFGSKCKYSENKRSQNQILNAKIARIVKICVSV